MPSHSLFLTLNPQPSTLNPKSHTLIPLPQVLCVYARHLTRPLLCLNPQSSTLDPKALIPTPYTLKPLRPKYCVQVGDTCRTCFWQSSRSASNRACEFIREPQWQGSQAARRPAPSAVADAAAAFCALLSLMITWREDRAHHQRNLLDSMSQVPVSVERYSQVPRAMGTGLVASRNSLSIFITVDITL